MPDYRPVMRFADRATFFTEFENALGNMDRSGPNLLVFHGMGGIGKSAFREELVRVRKDKEDRPAFGVVELPEIEPRPDDFLVTLRRDLRERNGDIAFPSFDIGYLTYLRKARPEFQTEALNWLREINTVFDFTLESGLLLLEVFSPLTIALPFKGLIAKILSRMIEHVYVTSASLERPMLKKLVAERAKLSGPQICERLPDLLAEDLRMFVEKKPQSKVVVLVDQYERLWQDEENTDREHPVDRAFQALVHQLQGALVMIFSRYPLHWSRLDEEWHRLLDGRQHAMRGLPADHAEIVLRNEPVEDADVRRAMIKTATEEEDQTVYPFLVELQVKHYRKILDAGALPHADNFASEAADSKYRRRGVIQRLLASCPGALREELKYLAVARRVDKKLLEEEFGRAAARTKFNTMRRSSLVEEAGGSCRFASTVLRDAIAAELDEKEKRDVHEQLYEYFDKRSRPLSNGKVDDAHVYALGQAAYHLAEYEPARLEKWRRDHTAIFENACREDALIPVLQTAFAKAASPPERPLAMAKIRCELGTAYGRSGHYPIADAELAHVCSALRNAAPGTPEEEVLAEAWMLRANLRLAQDDVQEAASFAQRAVGLAFGTDRSRPVSAPEALKIKIHWTQATLARLRDRFAESERWDRQARLLCERAMRDHPEDERFAKWHARAKTRVARSLVGLGRVDEAEAALSLEAESLQTSKDKDSLWTRFALAELAEVLRLQGRFSPALRAIEMALDDIERAMEPSSLQKTKSGADADSGRLYHELPSMRICHAKILRDMGRYHEAVGIFRQTLGAHNALAEQGSLQRILAEADLATALARATALEGETALERDGRLVEADSLFRSALEGLRRHAGASLSDAGRIRTDFADFLIARASTDKAEELLDEARAALVTVFGPDHYRVANVWQAYLRLESGTESDAILETKIAEIRRATTFDVTILARDWTEVPSPAAWTRRLPFSPSDLEDVGVEQVLLDDLYREDVRLLRFTFRHLDRPVHKFALACRDFFRVVDGSPDPLYGMNEKLGLSLTDDRVIPYLRLFSELVTGTSGRRLRLCESADQIDWRRTDDPAEKSALADAIDRVRADVQKPEVTAEPPGPDGKHAWRVLISFIDGDALHRSTFRVDQAGKVHDEGDGKPQFANLPISGFMRAQLWEQPIRIPGRASLGIRAWNPVAEPAGARVLGRLHETSPLADDGMVLEMADLGEFCRPIEQREGAHHPRPCLYRMQPKDAPYGLYAVGLPQDVYPFDGSERISSLVNMLVDFEIHEQNVVQYFKVFCPLLVAPRAQFVLVESVADLTWPDRTAPEKLRQLGQSCHSVELRGRDANEGFLVSGTVLYPNDRVATATFRISTKGRIELIEEELNLQLDGLSPRSDYRSTEVG